MVVSCEVVLSWILKIKIESLTFLYHWFFGLYFLLILYEYKRECANCKLICHIVYASEDYQKIVKEQLKLWHVKFGREFVTLINLIDIIWNLPSCGAYASPTEIKDPSKWSGWSDRSCVRNNYPKVPDGRGPRVGTECEQRSQGEAYHHQPPPVGHPWRCRHYMIHKIIDCLSDR
jgi:hypothetical protein